MARKFFCSLAAFAIACGMLSLSACSKRYSNLPAFSVFPITDAANQSVGRFKTTYLAEQIHAYYRGHAGGPIAVTTFVDIDNLYQSSTFGRLASEQLMSELVMLGYNVIEIRLSEALQIMAEAGEFGLSRETRTLRNTQQLSGVVVGTYAASPLRVYLNARIVDPRTESVVSVGSVEMAKTTELAKLLRTNSYPGSLERIPVRHLGYSFYPAPYYWPSYGYYQHPPLDAKQRPWENRQGEEKETPPPPKPKL